MKLTFVSNLVKLTFRPLTEAKQIIFGSDEGLTPEPPTNHKTLFRNLSLSREEGFAVGLLLHLKALSAEASEPEWNIEQKVTMGLTVSRKTAKHLAVRRKNWNILTVSRKIC